MFSNTSKSKKTHLYIPITKKAFEDNPRFIFDHSQEKLEERNATRAK